MIIYFATSSTDIHLKLLAKCHVEALLCSYATLGGGLLGIEKIKDILQEEEKRIIEETKNESK